MGASGVFIVFDLVSAFMAGAIAYNRTYTASSFVVFFVMGAIIPVVGVALAARTQAAPRPPGWYRDPWDRRLIRWHDGTGWTANTQPVPTS